MGAVVGASGNQSEEDEGYLLFLLGYRDFPSNYGFSDFLYFLEKWHHNDIKTVSTADSQISSSRIWFKGFFFSILKRIGEILEGSRQQQHSHFIGAGSSELWGGTRPLRKSKRPRYLDWQFIFRRAQHRQIRRPSLHIHFGSFIIHHSFFLVRGAITDFGGQYREGSGLFFEEEIIIHRGRILDVLGFDLFAGKERNREGRIDLEREVFI